MTSVFFDKKELKALINLVFLQGEPDSDEAMRLARALADGDFKTIATMIEELL